MSRTPARLAAACLGALLGFSTLDASLFRTGLYSSILEPDSSTGLFELILRREQAAQQTNGDNVVLTLGDSRFAISPKLCNQLTASSGLVFRSAGVAGTGPREWYYMLRDLDPSARRYRAIVFGVDDYDDVDGSPEPTDDDRTLHYVIVRLRLADVPGFAQSFHDPELRWTAWRGGLWKGFVLARDARSLLQGPRKRLYDVRLARHGYEEWTYDYVESADTMVGLSIDWERGAAVFPAGANDNQRGTVNTEILARSIGHNVRLEEYRREWFGRLVERYAGSPTRIVFLHLPRGPIPPPRRAWEGTGPSSIRDLAKRPGVRLGDEHAFEFLEHPQLFKDGTHLNRDGIARFCPRLVAEVGRLLGR